jgi:uncharacterized protein involved in outer membrane biogenesis
MKPAARKKIVIVLGVLVLLAFASALLIPKLFDPDRYHDRIVSELEKVLGGKVSIKDISWGLLKGLWLEIEEFEITGASAFPMDFKVSRIHAAVSLPPLFRKKIVLNHVRLENPDVRWRLQPVPQQAPGTKDPNAGEEPRGIALPLEIEDLSVTKGRVQVKDSLTPAGREIEREFLDIELKASNLGPGREMSFDISMKDRDVQGLGAFKAQGSFAGLTDSLTLQNPKLTVHATLSGLHADALKPYLGKAPWVQRLSGSLSVTVNYEGDLGSHHRAEGSMDLSQAAFSDPSLWDAALPGVETTITYRADLQADDLTVEKLEVRLGKLFFRGKGGVVGLKKRPLIKDASFSADVPLLDSVPLFPWKVLGDSAAFVRSIFEGGGKVEIEQAVLPPIDLAAPPPSAVALLNGIESTSRISGVSVELSPGIPRIKNIDIHVRLAQGTAQVQVLRDQFTVVDLPGISGKVAKLFEAPLIEVTVKGPVQVSNQAPEDLAAFFRGCGLEEVNGSADLDAAVVVDTSQPENVQIRGTLGLRDAHAKFTFSPVRLEGLRADLAIAPDAANITHLSTAISVPAGPSAPGGRFDLRLEARVDEWSRRPAVTLQRMKTSPVALPVVASLIPWEKLGESAEPVKQVFLNGGTVTIEEGALPKVELFKLPKSPVELLPKAKAAAGFAGLALEPDPSLPGLEDIKGRIKLENGVLTAAGVQGRMGPLSLPDLNIRVSRLDGRPKVTVAAKGPVQLAATSDERIEDFLKRYGLKSLVVSANMDLRADFDENLHNGWAADGSLVLAGVRAETYPEGVIMDDLQGRVTVNHKKATNITAENVKGRVNQAPVSLSGKIRGVGTPNLVVDVKANAKHLNLAHLCELSPSLRKLRLAGTVDMDLDIYIPYATAKKSRLNGMLATRNLNFQLAHFTVKKGDTEFNLKGDTAFIKKAQGVVNDTEASVTGRIANPVEPSIQLLVTSPDLNLDRLLPPSVEEDRAEKRSQGKGGHGAEKTMKTQRSPAALKTTAQVQLAADAGRYRGTEFQNLKLDATYDRGVIKQGDLSFGMEGGRVAMRGSGDIREPEHVTFTVSPNLTSIRLETLAALLGIPEVSVSGPISLTGRLQGKTGNSDALLASLSGDMEAQIGPGRIARIGRGGAFLARILSLTSIRGVLTGGVFKNFEANGFPFQTIATQTTFNNGNMDLTNFRFLSYAVNLNAQGRINLLEGQMDVGARLTPLGAVSTVMGFVPLVGKVAAGLTEIHFNLSGSLEDPRVRIIPGQGIADSIQDQARGVGSMFRGAAGLFRRDENR